jgi:hypothetical protein
MVQGHSDCRGTGVCSGVLQSDDDFGLISSARPEAARSPGVFPQARKQICERSNAESPAYPTTLFPCLSTLTLR